MSNSTMNDPMGNVVDEVRALRAEVSRETDGFKRMGEYLRHVREQHRLRTGPFADLPSEQPEDVRRAIAAADTGEPLIDDLRRVRR